MFVKDRGYRSMCSFYLFPIHDLEHVTLALKQLSLYILSLYESQPVKKYTVTHCHIMMCNMKSLNILDL